MLVPTMNLNEIYYELIRDFDTVKRKGKVEAGLLWGQMMRNQKQHEVRSINYKTARRNEWNIVFELTSEYMKTAYYVRSRDNTGSIANNLYFINQDGRENIYLIKYGSHFFERYNERMALGFNEPTKTIKHFFRNNFDFEEGDSQPMDDGSRLVHFAFEDGLGIGWKHEDKKMLCFKTFIANTTLTKNQQALVENLKNDVEFSSVIKAEHLRNKF